MVANPSDYIWSSYGGNAMGKEIRLLTPHPVYLALGDTTAQRIFVIAQQLNWMEKPVMIF
jgi:hypothetical protein